MSTFQQDLEEAVAYHGHLCGGQITGVRMARLGVKTLGIPDVKHFRNLIVYVECDRCIADAIGTVTGCKLGKRNLKCLDYGKQAASFLNFETGEAVRIARKQTKRPPEGSDLLKFYEAVTDEEMFDVRNVNILYRPEDLPGKPLDSMVCPQCGEEVIDGRQVVRNGEAVCKACADGSYYNQI